MRRYDPATFPNRITLLAVSVAHLAASARKALNRRAAASGRAASAACPAIEGLSFAPTRSGQLTALAARTTLQWQAWVASCRWARVSPRWRLCGNIRIANCPDPTRERRFSPPISIAPVPTDSPTSRPARIEHRASDVSAPATGDLHQPACSLRQLEIPAQAKRRDSCRPDRPTPDIQTQNRTARLPVTRSDPWGIAR